MTQLFLLLFCHWAEFRALFHVDAVEQQLQDRRACRCYDQPLTWSHDTCHTHLKVHYVDQTGVAAVAFLDHAQQLLLRDLREYQESHTPASHNTSHVTSMPKCAKATPSSSALICPLPSASMKRKMRSAIDLQTAGLHAQHAHCNHQQQHPHHRGCTCACGTRAPEREMSANSGLRGLWICLQRLRRRQAARMTSMILQSLLTMMLYHRVHGP